MQRQTKLTHGLRIVGTAALLGLSGCDLIGPEDDQPNEAGTKGVFILCEGAFGSTTASLWHVSNDLVSPSANVYQNLTGNPLGDTGQSLYIDSQTLYVVMNGSSTIEVLDLSGASPAFVRSIDMAGASPRFMTALGSTGYVTAWGVAGILVIDLTTFAVTDTFAVDGLPEDIIAVEGQLIVAVPLNSDFSASDRVLAIDPASGQITQTYTAGTGPQQLLYRDSELLVSRQWYDDTFVSYRGISRVNLTSGAVTAQDWGVGGGTDIFESGSSLYVATLEGVVPVGVDLSLRSIERIDGGLPVTYSAASDGDLIYIGSYSDFSSSGSVTVYSSAGAQVAEFAVGIGPGSFAFAGP